MHEFEEFARQFRLRTQARLEEFERILSEATSRPPAPAAASRAQWDGAETASNHGKEVGAERRRGRVKSVLREAGASAG